MEFTIPLVNKKGEFVGDHVATLETMEHYQILLGAEIVNMLSQPLRHRGRN